MEKSEQYDGPRAIAVRYDQSRKRVVIDLSSGIELAVQPELVEGLEHATAEQLSNSKISPAGIGIYFPDVDADVYIPGLLNGITGSRKWMAAHFGAMGGSVTTDAKRAASQANGRLGGRPKKVLATT